MQNNRQLITDQNGHAVGWFDVNKAKCIQEEKDWNGSNMISRATGSQWHHEALYLTAKGRWVLYSWSNVQGDGESYRLMCHADAYRWLMVNASEEDILGLPAKVQAEYSTYLGEKEV
jgi:hypothetical protein